MSLLKRIFLTMMGLCVVAILSSCGGSTAATPPTTAANTPAATSAPAPTTAPTAAPTTAPAAAPVVMTASAKVAGVAKTILTDAKGMTLYYYTPDTATTAACTGGCAANWPPLLFSGTGTPTASGTLPGTLSAVSSANGNQVLYNGHFLYTFVRDKAPGDVTGEGVGGKWHTATTDTPQL